LAIDRPELSLRGACYPGCPTFPATCVRCPHAHHCFWQPHSYWPGPGDAKPAVLTLYGYTLTSALQDVVMLARRPHFYGRIRAYGYSMADYGTTAVGRSPRGNRQRL